MIELKRIVSCILWNYSYSSSPFLDIGILFKNIRRCPLSNRTSDSLEFAQPRIRDSLFRRRRRHRQSLSMTNLCSRRNNRSIRHPSVSRLFRSWLWALISLRRLTTVLEASFLFFLVFPFFFLASLVPIIERSMLIRLMTCSLVTFGYLVVRNSTMHERYMRER